MWHMQNRYSPCTPGLSPTTIWNCCTRDGYNSDDITKVGGVGVRSKLIYFLAYNNTFHT